MQRRLRVITLQGAIKKSPILLSQYWETEWLDGNIIISYFGGSNNIFAYCKFSLYFDIVNKNKGIDYRVYEAFYASLKIWKK